MKNTNLIVESDSDVGILKGRYKIFVILPVVISVISGIVCAISILTNSNLETGFKVFLFLTTAIITALLCWLIVVAISVMRLFMFHIERINDNTKVIADKLTQDEKKEEVIAKLPEKREEEKVVVKKEVFLNTNKDSVVCLACGKKNKNTSKNCIYCGEPLPEEKPVELVSCKNCGALIKKTDTECFNCGEKVEKWTL